MVRTPAPLIAVALCLGTFVPASAQPPSLTDIVEAKSIDAVLPSPDGRRIAYRVISRSVNEDRVTVQWFMTSIRQSGDPIKLGHLSFPKTMPQFDDVVRPRAEWLASGEGLLAIQLDSSGSQLHWLRPTSDIEITKDPADVEDFRFSKGHLTIADRLPLADIRARQAQETRSGIHLDRTLPTEGMRLTGNFVVGTRTSTVRRLRYGDLLGEAYSGDLHWHDTNVPDELARNDHGVAKPADAIVQAEIGDDPLDGRVIDLGGTSRLLFKPITVAPASEEEAVDRIIALSPSGKETECRELICTGPSTSFRQIIYDRARNRWVIAYEPDYSGETSLYEWNADTGRSRLIFADGGRLRTGSKDEPSQCPIVGTELICVEARPTRPDRLVALDIRRGAMRVLAEPNAALAAKSFPGTRSLFWKDAEGRTTHGVLVLPGTGKPTPLVITTYRCHGFLQGATSNLTPEFMLAERGIAALCIDNNNLNGHEKDANGSEKFFGEQDAGIASYTAIIRQLAQDHVIDPARVGISGHSFTGNLIGYALTRTNLFAAAEIGSGITIDPNSYYLTAPEADSWRKAAIAANGLPVPVSDPDHLWARVSPALNASKITTPLLFQIPEVEYLMSLQLFGTLDDLHRPVDMYIFPMAGHDVESSPAQQVSRGQRSIDWFSYWLLPDWRVKNAGNTEVALWDRIRERKPLNAPAAIHWQAGP